MPFINSRVSVSVTDAQRETIKTKLGQVISLIPGKSEHWLMVEIADQCDLYFQGNKSQPTAFIEVKVFGKIPEHSRDELTRILCELYEAELQIPQNRIYVKYEEGSMWGWNGSNF